jgi:pimeloyl-ACP methyl ester carboxylesterase
MSTASQSAVRPVTLAAGGAEIAGLLAEADGPPRALVLAIHGSGTTSQYFDCRTGPGLSLLELGAACGYTVLAVDRPGYGDSAQLEPATAGAQAAVLLTLIDEFTASHDSGVGVFVMSHSSGTKVALTMAGDHERGRRLLGVEGSGTGVEFAPGFAAARLAGTHYSEMAWGSADLYPPDARDALVRVPTSPADSEDARHWPETIRRLAPGVTVPVRMTLAEEEYFYPTDRAALDELAGLFTSSPLVEVVVEPRSGHNVSVGWGARAYHLKVLAFVEQCILLRRSRQLDRAGDLRESP